MPLTGRQLSDSTLDVYVGSFGLHLFVKTLWVINFVGLNDGVA